MGIGTPRPSFFDELLPIGMRLIDSTPQASATSTTPAATSDAARFVACWLEPHCVSMVVAGVDWGRPAASHAVRGDVEALLADLADASADDLADLGGIDPRALHDRRLHDAQQLGGMDSGEAAASATDRRADGVDDVDAW